MYVTYWLVQLLRSAHPVVRPSTPGSPTIFDIPFLESKGGQIIWPSPSKIPLALPTSLKVKQFDFSLFKVLATRCDWGQQFDQLPLWHVAPLALSFYVKVNQFDFVLWYTGTHMYVTYWLHSNSLQCPDSCDTIHIWKSNYFWHTLLRVQEWSNNLTIYFKELMALPYFIESQTIWLFSF